jgi:hypothetical protein
VKVALLSYTNQTCGCGVVAHGLFRWLPVDSILSVGSVKGREKWTDRQIDIGIPSAENVGGFIERFNPDVIVSVETMFDDGCVCNTATKFGVRTANIIMQESYNRGRTWPDLFICPTRQAYDKCGDINKAYFDLPFEVEPFKFKARSKARRFLHIMGYGAAYNRRQTREAVDGFLKANLPEATLTVHCQQEWRVEYGHRDDPRVTYRLQTMDSAPELYEGFDVLLQPDSYAGFNLPLLEAKACGMPVITTDAPPMHELVRDPDALVPVTTTRRVETVSGIPSRLNMTQYLVTSDDVADTIRRMAAADIKAKSKRARKCAESHAWTRDRAEELTRILEGIL